jgi:uncharacterized membrane protein YgdD (TMEM256/DUF423 family)
MCCSNSWLTIGAVMGALGVTIGAFGAHGVDAYFAKKYEGRTHQVLAKQVPTAEKFLADYNTAATYQMYHALALIAVGLLSQVKPKRSLQVAGFCFLGGIVLFSGGLYVYTLADQILFGIIPVPIGGVLFIIGWISLAIATCPCGTTANDSTTS